MFDYHGLKALAHETGCRVKDLLALSLTNDPFYAEVPRRKEAAGWFADIWDRLGLKHGVHLRRAHYIMVSQPNPIPKPDGTPYLNTENDWKFLSVASLAARYLGLIPSDALVDRRNPDPLVQVTFDGDAEPSTWVGGANTVAGDLPRELPLPEIILSDFRAEQDFLVEIWCEKSAQNDILVPLSNRLGFNLITGVGEMSETATRMAVERAVAAGKPMRILYVSDFDPAGRSMPVAVSRKIEHKLHITDCEADIELEPIVLLPEQCEEFSLPRTPIKETERRAVKFEDRFGSGATELDALEALHPGALEETITAHVSRYIDPTLARRVARAESEIHQSIEIIEEQARERHADAIDRLSEQYNEIVKQLSGLENEALGLRRQMEEELDAERPQVGRDDIPKPRPADPIPEPLFSSRRDYFGQLDRYHLWQGKRS